MTQTPSSNDLPDATERHAARRTRPKALFFLGALGLATLGAASNACTVAPAPAGCDGGDCNGTAQDGGADTRPTTTTPPPPPPPPASCYIEEDALAIKATAPALERGLCTAADIAELADCLTKGDCKATIDKNKDCARCAIGALQGDNPETTPLGALLPVSDTTAVIATLACGAVITGRPECALELSNNTVCIESTCATCEDDQSEACSAEAASKVCKDIAKKPCLDALGAARAQWEPRCTGSGAIQAFSKVALVFCGPPSGDAGSRDAAPE